MLAENKQRMLITGASRGVGKACADYFRDKYQVITVARTGDVTYRGDLTNLEFLKKLCREVDADILINNAAVYGKDFQTTIDLNLRATGYLLSEFYKKMTTGHIINICSSSANSTGWVGMPPERIWYNALKSALKTLSKHFADAKLKNVKVTSIEPARINTAIGESLIAVSEEEYSKQTLPWIPMKPSYIAEVIDWILSQPAHVVISSIEIQNFKKG
ncbi:MAG: hypothetical protein A2W61_05285 [Deltaproteobacteria bacterium RIFCSPLOWO2_01_44_7]|nr:MAG: hypothetical protein A2712_02130 [Deltaproteobacteria bacterium RIFCSPHIGHO2_01_FULL_43_49]OGQ15077.1 MAG: hypothetical protein A3D22_03350 [Deltaproteobacteria bacterium RIFCSPHIGHO2_02_FULL_44_53]OGQ27303.1 MAG: hypothetical protein A3D98_02725 [Deltaproteobacteria bacterium RIFCSPHIGHO2_12_FULL_44_21]OGQ31594.1 MAG: hypothetical protein A2979_04510 [Deltaproteobacteria bacterium RIFCSPLOWO2_01_FULL_45_74]OGQ38190.1 MAG: hypothetical protein A2W61_05285 [Deltaproteobacteria bacterium 